MSSTTGRPQKLREGLRCAEEAEIFSRMLKVHLDEAHANIAAAKSRETAMAEAIKVDQDRHAQELEDALPILPPGPSVGRSP
jgi:hypothetical protein